MGLTSQLCQGKTISITTWFCPRRHTRTQMMKITLQSHYDFPSLEVKGPNHYKIVPGKYKLTGASTFISLLDFSIFLKPVFYPDFIFFSITFPSSFLLFFQIWNPLFPPPVFVVLPPSVCSLLHHRWLKMITFSLERRKKTSWGLHFSLHPEKKGGHSP